MTEESMDKLNGVDKGKFVCDIILKDREELLGKQPYCCLNIPFRCSFPIKSNQDC